MSSINLWQRRQEIEQELLHSDSWQHEMQLHKELKRIDWKLFPIKRKKTIFGILQGLMVG